MAKVFKTPISGDIQNFGSASSYAGFSSASNASYSFYAGARNSSGSAALFSVTPAGTLLSNSASISGVVNFISGSLGPFIVSSASLTSSSGIFSSSNVYISGSLSANTASFSGSVNLQSASISGSAIATQAWVQANSGGAAITTSSTSFTSTSIASSSVLSTTIPIGKTFIMSRLTTNIPARIRMYVSTATRDADVNRAVGTTPTGNHGLILEMITTTGILDYYISPAVVAYVSSSSVPINITNLSASSGSVIINLTRSILEQ